MSGCRAKLAAGQWWAWCGETDMGQTAPALCTECGGTYKRAEDKDMMDERAVEAGRRAIDMINASRETWEVYLTNVRSYLPESFENDCIDEGLADKTGAYIFVAFMTGISAKACADSMIDKLGVNDG